MNPIIDKFGVDAVVFKKKRGRARAYVKAPLSPQFYGWLLQLGPLVKLISPTEAVNEFNALLEQTFNRYKNAYNICSEAALRHWQRNAYRYAFTDLPLNTEQAAEQATKHRGRKSKKKQ